MPSGDTEAAIRRAPCILCGSEEREAVSRSDRHGKPLDTVMCVGCGLVHNHPIPTDEEVATFYRTRYRVEYKGAAEPRLRQIARNFSGVVQFFEANRNHLSGVASCLDVGAGSGEFLAVAKALGWRCKGIEPSQDYAAFAAQHYGLDIEATTLDVIDFPDGSFDFLRLNHVVEHLNDPVRALRRVRSWLKDDGLLYVDVPNVEHYAARKTRGRMFHFGHIFNFNPYTIRACAARAGFAHYSSAFGEEETTANFFRKAPETSSAEIVNADNAAKVRQAIAAHYQSPRLTVAISRLVARLRKRTLETAQAGQLGSPEQIAGHFSRRAAEIFEPPAA